MSKQSFKLSTPPRSVYRLVFYRNLESSLVTSKTLVLLGHSNIILDVGVDSVGSMDRQGNHGFKKLLESYYLVYPYRLAKPLISMWT